MQLGRIGFVGILSLVAMGCGQERKVAGVACQSLDEGHSRVISGDSGTGVASAYSLTRVENGFLATVRPRFIHVDGSSDATLTATMKLKLEQCYSNASKFLRGADGSRLQVKL